ncbi:MAG: cation diffusion facilitator family transporter [Clostridiales bacterium]|nr:cation diffusion facilitator family transporter [Clostridiales bacterium]
MNIKRFSSNENSAVMKTVVKVSLSSIILNIALTVFKLTAGIISGSGAMVSDAVHSASDVFGTIIVMIGAKMSGKKSDKEHPYGHERIECVAAILLATVLFLTGLGIGYTGIKTIISGEYNSLGETGIPALTAAIVSIIVKEIMYHYTKAAAKKIDSSSLMADAWHHRSDALSSIGALIGIGGAMLGVPVLDPLAGIIICIFILKASFDIYLDAINKMIDHSCDSETQEKIKQCALSQDGVLNIDELSTRMFGNRIYVEIEICADGSLSLNESHMIAETVHHEIERQIPRVKHVMVHVNPQPDE